MAGRGDARPPAVVGVLLAGGLARRMGGDDKCLRPLLSDRGGAVAWSGITPQPA